MNTMSVQELSKELRVNPTTLRTWLDSYKFAKYRKSTSPMLIYTVTTDFWNTLYDFIYNKRSEIAKKVRKKIALLRDTAEIV